MNIVYRIAIDQYTQMSEREFLNAFGNHARTLLQFATFPQRDIALWLWRGTGEQLRLSNDWLPIPNLYTLTIEREGTGMTFYDIPTMAKHLKKAADVLRKRVNEIAVRLDLLLFSAQDQFERGKLPIYFNSIYTISPVREFSNIDAILCCARAFDIYLAEHIERSYNELRAIDRASEQFALRLDREYVAEKAAESGLEGYTLANFNSYERDNLRSGGQDALRIPRIAAEVERLRGMGLHPFVLRVFSSFYIAVQPDWLPAKYLVKRI